MERSVPVVTAPGKPAIPPPVTRGAEGLSGLAKAFFYAGPRALPVSHWSVPSDAGIKGY